MENKVSRPLLLTGLIISLIVFAILTISCIVSMTIIPALLEAMGSSEAGALGDAMIGMLMFFFIIIAAFSILGVVFSAVSIARWNLPPTEFDKKKGLITTTFVFCVIIAVLELISLFSMFDVLNLILTIVLIVAAVFIMIDRTKNKALLEKAKTDAQNAALNAQQQPTQAQANEQQAESAENKTE